MNNKKEKHVQLQCSCGNFGHFFVIEKNEFGIYGILCEAGRDFGFFDRLKRAIMYMFRRWDMNYLEVVLTKKDIIKMRDFLKKL